MFEEVDVASGTLYRSWDDSMFLPLFVMDTPPWSNPIYRKHHNEAPKSLADSAQQLLAASTLQPIFAQLTKNLYNMNILILVRKFQPRPHLWTWTMRQPSYSLSSKIYH